MEKKSCSNKHELVNRYYFCGVLLLSVRLTLTYKKIYLFGIFPIVSIIKKPHKVTWKIFGMDIFRKKTEGSYIVDAPIAVCNKRKIPIVYFSIGSLATKDMRTGIGRVVRSYIKELFLLQSELNFELVPIYRNGNHYGYLYAREYVEKNFPDYIKTYAKVEFAAGDHFVEMTTDSKGVNENFNYLLFLKEQGVYFHLFIHDLIAYKSPEYFTQETVNESRLLLGNSILFPHIICISKSVAEDYRKWKQSARIDAKQKIDVCYLSGDFERNQKGSDVPFQREDYSKYLKKNYVLSVSTLEPRKGYVKAIKVLESLWLDGFDLNYIIIGKKGWKSKEIVDTIINSKFYNEKLYWFSNIDDASLALFYQNCKAVLVPSEDEGFGLPLAEASYYNKPVIANRIGVFTEIAPTGCYFFELNNPILVKRAIKKWQEDDILGRTIKINKNAFPTWRESSQKAMNLIFNSSL